jgi:hypothetical protein
MSDYAFNSTGNLLQVHQFEWQPLGSPFLAKVAWYNEDKGDHDYDEVALLVAFAIADISFIGEGVQMYYLTHEGNVIAASPVADWCWRFVDKIEGTEG